MKARIAAGFKTGRSAAKKFGWVYESYNHHENGIRGISRVAAKYANSFKVSEAWLLTGEGEEPEAPKLPIRGYAAGSVTGYNIMTEEPVDWSKRPPALTDIEEAYGVYVQGKSMEPQFFEGDLVFVHPFRHPRQGDIVIIQQSNKREPPIAFIKRFERRTATHLIASQHNPKAEISYLLPSVLAVHKVMSLRELYGL